MHVSKKLNIFVYFQVANFLFPALQIVFTKTWSNPKRSTTSHNVPQRRKKFYKYLQRPTVIQNKRSRMTHKYKKKLAATRKQTKEIQNIPHRLKASFRKRIRKNVRMSQENINSLVEELLLWITMEPKLPNHRAVLANKKKFCLKDCTSIE